MTYKTKNKLIIKLVDKNPEIIVQIVHGAMEHIGRYEDFIEDLNKNGISVITRSLYGSDQDLLINNKTNEFYHSFNKEDLVDSVLEVSNYIKEHFPLAKHILLGHSMGSFISKKVYFEHTFNYDGLILVGTNFISNFKKNLAGTMLLPMSNEKISRYGNWVVFGQNDLLSKIIKRQSNWISTNEENFENYTNDELTGNDFDGIALKTVISLLNDNSKKDIYKNFNHKHFPILLISGSDDPVSNFGKQIKKFQKFLIKNDFTNTSIKLYQNSRHEVLMDTEKELVIKSIINWIKNNFY